MVVRRETGFDKHKDPGLTRWVSYQIVKERNNKRQDIRKKEVKHVKSYQETADHPPLRYYDTPKDLSLAEVSRNMYKDSVASKAILLPNVSKC